MYTQSQYGSQPTTQPDGTPQSADDFRAPRGSASYLKAASMHKPRAGGGPDLMPSEQFAMRGPRDPKHRKRAPLQVVTAEGYLLPMDFPKNRGTVNGRPLSPR